jgi:hypothetical protein
MKLEDQVCILGQAKKLSILGIRQGLSVFFWDDYNGKQELMMNETPKDGYDPDVENTCFSAFTAAELSAMLPARVMSGDDDYFPQIHKGHRGWYIQYQTNKKGVAVNAEGEIDRPRGYLHNTYRVEYNMAEAFASYLILLLETKLITPAEVNARLANS